MLDLTEIIAKAEAAERQTADIEVIFDTGISREIEELRTRQQELLDQVEAIEEGLATELEVLARDSRASDRRPGAARKRAEEATTTLQEQLDALAAQIEDADTRAAGFLVTFRITALHGFEWEEITSRSMPRDGHAEDASRNYNVDEVTQIVATRSAVRVGPDGALIDVSKEQWDGIWKTLPSLGRRQFKTSVWILNEYATRAAQNEAVAAARKVLTAQQAVKQPSPSDSASTRDASAGGNPRRSPTTSTTTEAA